MLQPIARIVPGKAGAEGQTVRVAIFALAGMVGLKWVIAVAMAAVARQP